MDVAVRRLIEIIREIAQGNYSNDIMPLTAEGQPEPVRTVAEAVGMMMVKIEAREYQLEMMVEELKDLDFLGPSLEYVHCHHERPDGKGYPRNLKTPEIPLGARILAVADSYDAMTTDRPYQKAKSREAAIGILKQNAGTKWDEACVAAVETVLTDQL